ncbi:putative RelA/SpoT domain protein [uncultured Woeseiaceae bacterium]|uniref:Putative RelA/SpoT domain protein n=1 Tax=uncultured Woeseiaceae bacterium TaxID=1983305 RepID=A0A7D9D1K0_9GAMM|nr:putative RelA/SpoT domain protein [uncultured Woeseiaceae bacterium]
MSRIDERLMKIMTDHLRPAGYEFQKVKHDFGQLLAGQEIFDKDIFELIHHAEDNNTLFELLERYKDYVLPNYSDLSSYADQIYAVIEAALELASILGDATIETPIGSFEGKNHADILDMCLQILSIVRYLDFDMTHELLLKFHREHVRESEQDTFCEYVEKIAAHHHDVIQKYGYVVQKRLVDVLGEKSDTDLLALSRYVLAVCRALLTPTISKTEWSYKEVTFGKINLPGTTDLGEIRHGALKILQRLASSSDRSIRRSAAACMRGATETPHAGNYDDALLNIVFENTNWVIRHLIANLAPEESETVQADEEWVLHLYQRARGLLKGRVQATETRQLADETKSLALQYRKAVAEVPNYERYKVLVGFRSVFDQEWDDERWGWEQKEKFREEKISEYIDSITEDNIDGWIAFFSLCVKADSTDLATFQHFTRFLQDFARAKPELAHQALMNPDSGLQPFMHIILLGFAEADRYDRFESVTSEFIDRGDRLWECARPFVLSPLQNRAILHRVFDSAIEEGNASVLYQVIAAVITNREFIGDEIDTLFLPALRFLTEHQDTGWIGQAWFRKEAIALLAILDEESAAAVLDNLVFLPQIDHDAERLLEPIVNNHPALVVGFFGNRLDIENQRESKEHYDAIPYDFYSLSTALSAVPDLLVDAALGWFQKQAELFQYRGANLISNTFPEFNDTLEQKLLELIATGEEQLLDFVVSILRNYHGETFLHEVCKQIVMVADPGSHHVRDVMIILEESGVMSGEFGFADRCKRKKEEIEYWLKDEDPKVRSFTERYIRGLDRQRAAELRRVGEEIELRKHQFE